MDVTQHSLKKDGEEIIIVPNKSFKDRKIEGVEITGGTDYIVIYKHDNSDSSYFYTPDKIEFHNYKGVIGLVSHGLSDGWSLHPPLDESNESNNTCCEDCGDYLKFCSCEKSPQNQ